MAEYKHQVQDFRAGRQHLANHTQEALAHPAVLIHQRRAALETVQDLERQRLLQGIHQHPAGAQHQ